MTREDKLTTKQQIIWDIELKFVRGDGKVIKPITITLGALFDLYAKELGYTRSLVPIDEENEAVDFIHDHLKKHWVTKDNSAYLFSLSVYLSHQIFLRFGTPKPVNDGDLSRGDDKFIPDSKPQINSGKKPTIEELEKILDGPPCKIQILPNGELKHISDKSQINNGWEERLQKRTWFHCIPKDQRKDCIDYIRQETTERSKE